VKLEIRPYEASDSLSDLTALLHRAYRVLKAMGFNYTATDQDESITKRRLESGHGFVALLESKLIGTITLVSPKPESSAKFYRDHWFFTQFAVEPDQQGAGIGGRVLEFVEREARARGATQLGLDTSEGAHHLIAYYEKRGYRTVDTVQWDGKTYRSVVMRKSL
jgi:GNAT superfamily N-acetyltransferase